MSQIRDPSSPTQEPLKSVKQFLFNTTFYLTTALKAVVFVFLVASISLFLHSAFTNQTRWFRCAECPNPTQLIDDGDCKGTADISSVTTEETNLTHLIFGIGGSAKTWESRRRYSELWWQPNVTRGHVWLDEVPAGSGFARPEKSPPYRVSEDWTRFKYIHSQSAVRIARIVLESFRLGLAEARWFVMGDDDTVFFTDNLVTVLRQYDHRQMYYIGGSSESVEQDEIHSFDMAFGGGGFAISYGLAQELAKILDGCIDRYYNLYGSDQRIYACLCEIGVSLTKNRGFHQIDIRGDAYGLLAAHPVTPLISLHHLDAVNPLIPGKTQADSLEKLFQAYQFDPGQIVQQTICYDKKRKWSVSISWGYTVQIYPSILSAMDLAMPLQTFKTWRSWSDGPFTFKTRPARPEKCEMPVVYFLDKVEDVGGGQTRSTYEVKETENKCGGSVVDVHRVVVLASKMDPTEWYTAPRRRCCEIIDEAERNTLKVRIGRCKRFG